MMASSTFIGPKCALEDLPGGIKLHDHLILRANGWHKVSMNPRRLLAYKRFLRVKAKYRGRAIPSNADGRRALYDEVLQDMISAKAL